jgi:3-hydroxyisobutyrate dehydrogenase-like beta-hydroxyacid dehydrogenase
LLDAVTRGRTELGDDPGAACAVKLAGNLLVLAMNAALTDALSLGASYGVPPETLAALFGDTIFASPIYKNYGQGVAKALTSRAPNAPGFSVRLGRKDAALAVDAASATETPLRLGERLRDDLDAAIANGLADADVTSLALVAVLK